MGIFIYQSNMWANLVVMSVWPADQHLHLAAPAPLVQFRCAHTIRLASGMHDVMMVTFS